MNEKIEKILETSKYFEQIEKHDRLMKKVNDFSLPPEILKTISDFESSIAEINYELPVNEDIYYQRESLELLRKIEGNTSQLNVLVELMQMSVKKQNEIAEWIKEINMIATAQTSEEADSLYKKIMRELGGKVDDAETLSKLYDYGKLTLNGIKLILNARTGTDFEIK